MGKERLQILDDYTNRMLAHMITLYPDKNPSKMKKVIEHIAYNDVQNFPVALDNSYTKQHSDTNFLTLLKWMEKEKPIVAGNGTLFKRQDQAINPDAAMLELKLGFRAETKAQLFELLQTDDPDQHLIMNKENTQKAFKQSVNSSYGGSGSPYCSLYDKWCAPSTTLTAQQVISTVEQTFEMVLGENYTFISTNEVYDWIYHVRNEKIRVDSWLTMITHEELYDDLKDKLMLAPEQKEQALRILHAYILALPVEEVSILFYKLNFHSLLRRNKYLQELIVNIINRITIYPEILTNEEWNQACEKDENLYKEFQSFSKYRRFRDHKLFVDPNKPPEEIQEPLKELIDLCMKYSYSPFISFDRIYRLRNFKRAVVSTIDTDSNFIILDNLVDIINNIYYNHQDYNQNMKRMDQVFIAVGILLNFITKISKEELYLYSKNVGVMEEFQRDYDMKNELLVLNMILARVKKRYLGQIINREGVHLTKPVYEIKGFEFRKAATSDICEKEFIDTCKRNLIDPETINIKGLIRDIKSIQHMIRKSILAGETKYLPIGNLKAADAYADPDRMLSFRAACTWNILFPHNNIRFPSKGHILRMKLFTEEDCKPLKDLLQPNVYDDLIYEVFHNPKGHFITEKYKTTKDKVTGNTTSEFAGYRYKGIQAVAIPYGMDIPEFLIQFADINNLVNTVVSPMKSVLEIFDIPLQMEGLNRDICNRQTSTITNVIKF